MRLLGVVIFRSLMYIMVNVYIPSCGIVVHVYLGSSVGRSHALRAESPGFESRPVGFFFSVYFYFLLISKDGCEKGRVTPRSWT